MRKETFVTEYARMQLVTKKCTTYGTYLMHERNKQLLQPIKETTKHLSIITNSKPASLGIVLHSYQFVYGAVFYDENHTAPPHEHKCNN